MTTKGKSCWLIQCRKNTSGIRCRKWNLNMKKRNAKTRFKRKKHKIKFKNTENRKKKAQYNPISLKQLKSPRTLAKPSSRVKASPLSRIKWFCKVLPIISRTSTLPTFPSFKSPLRCDLREMSTINYSSATVLYTTRRANSKKNFPKSFLKSFHPLVRTTRVLLNRTFSRSMNRIIRMMDSILL